MATLVGMAMMASGYVVRTAGPDISDDDFLYGRDEPLPLRKRKPATQVVREPTPDTMTRQRRRAMERAAKKAVMVPHDPLSKKRGAA